MLSLVSSFYIFSFSVFPALTRRCIQPTIRGLVTRHWLFSSRHHTARLGQQEVPWVSRKFPEPAGSFPSQQKVPSVTRNSAVLFSFPVCLGHDILRRFAGDISAPAPWQGAIADFAASHPPSSPLRGGVWRKIACLSPRAGRLFIPPRPHRQRQNPLLDRSLRRYPQQKRRPAI
jgi:hypothetical protein